MILPDYKENRIHGTIDFPFAYYKVDLSHPRYNMVCHWHPENELIYIHEGDFSLQLNNQTYQMTSGSCAWINSAVLHSGVPQNCLYSCIVFDLEKILQIQPWVASSYPEIITAHLSIPVLFGNQAPDLMNYILSICKAFAEKNSGYHFQIVGNLLMLISELINRNIISFYQDEVDNQHQVNQIKQVLTFISLHYEEQLSIEELANYISLNPNYFCKIFKSITHQTPIEYLNCYRIERACEQLVSKDHSITDIAYQCGFRDSSYFTKVFKKYKGMVPSHYLNSL